MSGLQPGMDIDLRGTELSTALVESLLTSLRDPATWQPRLGDALFAGAEFVGQAPFRRVEFRRASFDGAVFRDGAHFTGAVFAGAPGSARALSFKDARFHGDANFAGAVLADGALFSGTAFTGKANFDYAEFGGSALFHGARFAEGPWFMEARGISFLGLTEAVITEPTVSQISAERIDWTAARFEAAVTLKVEAARMDFSRAVFAERCTIASMEHHVADAGIPAIPSQRTSSLRPSVISLAGVDASMVLLFDVDLAECSFAGAHNLDQLQIEGSCTFAFPPRNRRWARRNVIAEEARWRGWQTNGAPAKPAALAHTYRQLRKAREDAKDEPGAADFYYGEMEMRRQSQGWSTGERWLLQAYWLLSGYGLRASRALGWLAAAMMMTIVLMMGFGIPDEPGRPYPASSGVIGKQDPRIQREFTDRFTSDRAAKAADIVINSVVFRSSGQGLTTIGRYIEMASRFTEPILLGLAALAIRGRVKRGG
ncbi:pentapeptide repeat-containing protein [Streptomyces piniterrae]|uniref:pentapeptide repeat-containing protein n=1 Tax=Streptomyces piniterrae TaxID=2571125 RepID=UPI001FE979B5|nr:pentapeptide repeat-containing protein [Streptomyces piniterrae]